MTDLVAVALIAALPSTIAAVASLINRRAIAKVQGVAEQTHSIVNSRFDGLTAKNEALEQELVALRKEIEELRRVK